MQLAIVTAFAVICELLVLTSFKRGPMLRVAANTDKFVSIDCGGSTASYTDAETTLPWVSDSKGFGLENVSHAVDVSLPAQYQWLNSMRIFEGTQSKYCYVFNQKLYGIVQTLPYLVRASFWTGGEPAFPTPNKEQISFKLLINADVWDDVIISLPQKTPLVKEVYVLAMAQGISVCVSARVGETAFISSLELRPLKNRWDSVNKFVQAEGNDTAPKALFLYSRLDLGSSTGKDIRYPDDVFDRIWSADSRGPALSTARTIPSIYTDDPPSAVLQTALVSIDNASFTLTINDFTKSYDLFYELHFAEISDSVTALEDRVFNVNMIPASGSTQSIKNLDLLGEYKNANAEFYSTTLMPVDTGGFLTFSFERASTSTFGPLVNALELRYISKTPMSLGTDHNDVLKIEFIKDGLQGFDSWRGDPCLPYPYDWLSCDQELRPRITKLSLEKRNITAKIPEDIGQLKSLIEINLQGNNLSGLIPDSIAQLPNLTTLLLQDNNLSGPIPQALLDKKLDLRLAGNPILCKDNNATYCGQQPVRTTEPKKGHLPLVAILVSTCVVVLILLASIFILHLRGKGKNNHAIAVTHAEVIKLSHHAQIFTSQQIERITNDFKTKLGAGGFGDVFFGKLSTGLNVAVKVSSCRDGTQEGSVFLNEVALLSRVHHKNLVEFVGYCIQPRLVLVYEYMAKGSLEDHLHGNAKGSLTWRDRLKIVVGAAQGLEYLHKGCKPPIIHRDVKCSNILLDEELEGRISDFGISRSKVANMDTHMTVTNVQGTAGYIAPEYAELRITEKIDVFAFGVVLLEVVSGRRPFVGAQHIVNWVRPLLNQSEIQKIVDPSIAVDYNMSSMWKVLEVAMSCVQLDTEGRPDMHEVSSELNSALSFELQNETVMLAYDPKDLPFDSVNVLAR